MGEKPREKETGAVTDESFTPPHGDPEKAHLGREHDEPDPPGDDSSADDQEPGAAEGHTDNKAGG